MPPDPAVRSSLTVSCPTRPAVITHPFRGTVVLVASPAIDDQDAAGWWAWIQANALPPNDPGHAKEQAWLAKAWAHWPQRTDRPDADAYVDAFERDRLCAELLGTDITEPPEIPAMDVDTGELHWVRHLRPAMQDALVRGLLVEGLAGSSDLLVSLTHAPNVDLVRRVLTHAAATFVRAPDGHLTPSPAPDAGANPTARHPWPWVWSGALHAAAEGHLWSSVDDQIGLLIEMGWAMEGSHEHQTGQTPLSCAVTHSNPGAVRALLRHGADPLSAWAEVLSPVGEDALPLFLAHGVIPTWNDLYTAVKNGADDATRVLLAQGLDPFPPDEVVRPERLPRLLRLARARVWADRRDDRRHGFTPSDTGATVNLRRLETIGLARAVDEAGRETGAGTAGTATASDAPSPLRRRL